MNEIEFVTASDIITKKQKIDDDNNNKEQDIYTLKIKFGFGDVNVKKLIRTEFESNAIIVKINENEIVKIDFYNIKDNIESSELICKIKTTCNDSKIVGFHILSVIEKKAEPLIYNKLVVSLSKDVFNTTIYPHSEKKND